MSQPDTAKTSAKNDAFFEALLRTAANAPRQQILPRQIKGPVPLSFAQQRLWFLNRLGTDDGVYNVVKAFRLTGHLDPAILERCLNELVNRHEILRTTFTTVDEQPVQVIKPALVIPLTIIDLTHISDTEREIQVEQVMARESQKVFDLTQLPLFQVTLLQLTEQEQIVLFVMHHIITDGWSMGVLVKELSTLYEAFSSGQTSLLPQLPIQYADYALWQKEWLQGEVLEKQLAYWKKSLSGAPPLINLPTDYPRPAVQTFQGGHHLIELSKPLTEALNGLTRQESATLFMTLLAAFNILLGRYSGQDDVVVGTPIANRNRFELEGLIGFFVNTLALRTDLSDNPTFKEFLNRVRQIALEAYSHQDIPFEKLVEELRPERNLSHTPLFQVFFNMQNLGNSKLEPSGVEATPLLLFGEPQARFDLTVYVKELNERIALRFVYNTDLFSNKRIAELSEQYKYLLEQIVEKPDQEISVFSLATPQSRAVLPDPAVALPEPHYKLVTDLFAGWVNSTPALTAISQGNRTWTYTELAESAHTLARILLAHGVKKGDVVAVTGPRSFGLIAGMLGVFLGGGVLFTLDENLPAYRQNLMLKETKANYLLQVGAPLANEPETDNSLTKIRVEPGTGQPIYAEQPINPQAVPLPQLTPDDPAYVFFTSGTTGIPKGILGNHKGLAHFLNWQCETFAVGPQDRCAQLTALSFDVVLRDIFLPLVSGATLCLPESRVDLEPAGVLTWLEQEQISLLHTVPSLAEFWLTNVPAHITLPTLRRVFFAGEALTDTLVNRWRKTFPNQGQIVNLYGPTETTMAKCFYQVPNNVLPGIQPVGQPQPQTQALVLTKSNQLCGIGEPGEIVIRTPFRTLGYINASQEDQKRFVKNPFRDDDQDLLYFTGDRGRYRPDGLLEILGRLDDQVKIRGIRVEPGEISAILGRHPNIKQAAVLTREDVPGKKYLAAYIVPNQDWANSTSELRNYLKEKLPEYMVPSAFVMLETIPLTANGKINRRDLPVPDQTSTHSDNFVAPGSAVEKELANIWVEILGIEQVGIYDNFFEVGGHSLLATRVISRVRREFQIDLALRTIFEKPTLGELAGEIELLKKSEANTQTSVITPISRRKYQIQRSSLDNNKGKIE